MTSTEAIQRLQDPDADHMGLRRAQEERIEEESEMTPAEWMLQDHAAKRRRREEGRLNQEEHERAQRERREAKRVAAAAKALRHRSEKKTQLDQAQEEHELAVMARELGAAGASDAEGEEARARQDARARRTLEERERLQNWIREELSHFRPAPDEREVLNDMLAEKDLLTLRAIWDELEPGMRERQDRSRAGEGTVQPYWMKAPLIAARRYAAAGDVMPREGQATTIPHHALRFPRGFANINA
jgi:hypothetical protein